MSERMGRTARGKYEGSVQGMVRANLTGAFGVRFMRTLAVLACCCLAFPAGAGTTWYVCSGITGADPGGITGADVVIDINASDANAGTDPNFPLLTLGAAGLQGRMADGDTAYISGRFYVPDATAIAFHAPLHCNVRTFAQWPGQPPAMIRGGNKVAAGAWLPVGVAAFTAPIGASLGSTLATVVFDYDHADNIAPLSDGSPWPTLGRRTSHLTPAPEGVVLSVGTGEATGKFFYNPATGFLTVALPGGAHPASAQANGVEYAVRGRNAFYLTSDSNNDRVNTGNTFTGLRFALWADSGSGSPLGTPIAISNGNATLISGCIFEDSGIHSYSFGSRCTFNVCQDNTHIGMAPGGIACVFNATGTSSGVPNSAIGCRILNDAVYVNSFLAHDGSLANRGSPVGGFICHGPVVDIELENFRVTEYTPPGLIPPDSCVQFSISDAPAPSDPFDPSTYAVRIRQTDPALLTVANGTRWPDQGAATSAAFINCIFRFPMLDVVPGLAMIDLRSVRGTTAFFGCEFTANLGKPGGDTAMFAVGPLSNVLTLNCSGYDTSLTHGPHAYSIFRYWGVGGFIFDFQSAWGFRTPAAGAGTGTRQVCAGDAAIGSAYHWFLDPALWNVSAAAYSDNPAFNTAAEWTTVIDPVLGGVTVHLTANPFADASGAAGLAPTLTFASLQKIIALHTLTGVNGLPYDGRYGAYQFGGALCLSDFNTDGFVNGADFDEFVVMFELGDAAADFNSDTFVTGEDFDGFVEHFESGC